MSYNLVNPTTGALTRVSGNIRQDIIPSNASTSNKLITKSDADALFDAKYYSASQTPDCDSITENYVLVNAGNSYTENHYPAQDLFFIKTIYSGATDGFQTAIAYGAIDPTQKGIMYSRVKMNGTWSSWQKLVTESDLDATVIKGKHYHGYIDTATVTIDISKLNITQYCTFEVTIRALYAAAGNVTNVKYIYNASAVATPVKAYTVYNVTGFEPTITFANDGSKLTSITITANGQLNTIDVNVSF